MTFFSPYTKRTTLAYMIVDYFLFAVFMLVYFKVVIYLPIEGISRNMSFALGMAIPLLGAIVGVFLRLSRSPSILGMAFDYIIGFGIYAVIAYYHYYSTLINVLGIIAVVFIVFITGGIIVRDLNSRQAVSVLLKNEGYIAILCLILLVTIGVNNVRVSNKLTDRALYRQTYTRDSSMDEAWPDIYDMVTGGWNTMDTDERMEMLQTIVDVEANHLGLTLDLEVRMDDLGPTIAGYYNDSKKAIYIHEELVNDQDVFRAISTILHEAYHAYEYDLVNLYEDTPVSQRDLLLFDHCDEYLYEMHNYSDILDIQDTDCPEFEDYYNQYMEMDSREYASSRISDYYPF